MAATTNTKKQVTKNRVKKPVTKPKKSEKSRKNIKVSSKSVNYTLCIPTTILSNCKNLSQVTYAVYQVAKAAIMFNVGEIIVLDLGDNANAKNSSTSKEKLSDAMLIASLLQFFVTPPYLVNSIFKKQFRTYYKEASKLPRLTALPFVRFLGEDEARYREGLAIRMEKVANDADKSKKTKKAKEFKQTKFINIGKGTVLELKTQLVPVNVRVTVDTLEKKVVSPQEAYGDFVGAKASYGYHVRVAKSFGSIFTECSYPQGYTQAVYVNSGDYYYNEKLKKYHKLETKLPYVEKIIKQAPKPPAEMHSESNPVADPLETARPANLLLLCGKWDHVKKSFERSKDQFEGCDGPHQFFDAQLELPGAVPQGNITIPDSCMISLSIISAL
ncbi:hypothetical protein HG535_0E00280 [Zygotorulaspora mrakii]|uniref:Uncharacterized protein n=1 Tax=Zygotorulaspora mrakii TaxID=42260 RepID=A0A7H9B3G5_ZYGMR|nr:uncharacterized protein HG535_0E00280 [Zygotorulaspora mrakii]QLG72944.1 hypothetical protein HG535_0E00280 [Zygotorulaspora mrakii]